MNIAALQRRANLFVDFLCIDIFSMSGVAEIPSQSVSQPAVSQSEISQPVVSQVVSQSCTSLTDSVTAGGGLLALPSDLLIPVISEGAHSVDLVRQVYSVSYLETPDR